MDPQANPQQNKKYIFIDTCVIQFTNDKNKSKSEVVTQCLNTFSRGNYTIAISEITFYENLHGLWGAKATKADAHLRTYEYKEVTRFVLQNAALFGSLYHDEKQDGIDLGDKVIAATAFVEKGFVLTANHKDFPHPFFITEKSYALPYEVGHYTKTLDLTLYKPNFALIARRINELRTK